MPSSFPDLRDLNQPLSSRLSLASAGTPGDDLNDIVLIRDEWAHSRARNQCRRGRVRLKYGLKETSSLTWYSWMLSLRLGTFNVNGKMPTQDLAAWVRGGNTTARLESSNDFLPAVKEISPLSLGEVVKDPFDSQRDGEGAVSFLLSYTNPHSCLASRSNVKSTSAFSTMSYSSAASTSALRDPSTTSTFSVAQPDNTAFTPLSSTVTSNAPTNSSISSSDPSETLVPAIPESPEVPTIPISKNLDPTESEPDFDILVLGFEELDLSTEALLYSTSTAREDAWTVAVFAALGEKAELYEKVNILFILHPCNSRSDTCKARLETTCRHARHGYCEEISTIMFFKYHDYVCWSRATGTYGNGHYLDSVHHF